MSRTHNGFLWDIAEFQWSWWKAFNKDLSPTLTFDDNIRSATMHYGIAREQRFNQVWERIEKLWLEEVILEYGEGVASERIYKMESKKANDHALEFLRRFNSNMRAFVY